MCSIDRAVAFFQALLGAACGQSVTDLMQAVGIVNFGRYAQYYRQQVGVVPRLFVNQPRTIGLEVRQSF